jgi:hypothetical protein
MLQRYHYFCIRITKQQLKIRDCVRCIVKKDDIAAEESVGWNGNIS